MSQQLLSFIQQSIAVSQEEFDLILAYFKPLKLKKNHLLLDYGETSQRIFFITSGCLRIFFINDDGQDATRHFAFENQMATALVSFITREASGEFVQAMEETELLSITHEDFYGLLELLPKWEKFYRCYLEMAYVTSTRRLRSFLTLDSKEKYQQLLQENPRIVQRLPNKMVASYLNISQETLSRLNSKV